MNLSNQDLNTENHELKTNSRKYHLNIVNNNQNYVSVRYDANAKNLISKDQLDFHEKMEVGIKWCIVQEIRIHNPISIEYILIYDVSEVGKKRNSFVCSWWRVTHDTDYGRVLDKSGRINSRWIRLEDGDS